MGHPVGLWVLFTTEMWERFCYYGMRAFLVLYLCATLNGDNPGFGWQESDAYKLYGWFTGLVYLTPLLGGWIADRLIGTHKSVVFGGILIAIGEFCLFITEYFRAGATETITLASNPVPYILFMVGLGVLILGNGFFKPCISVMVGELYEPHDSRRDVAFTYFYMGINVGAFLAPFIAGTVAEKIGWHWGFLTACIGMIFGLCTYSLFRPKYLGHIGMIDKTPKNTGENKADFTNAVKEKAPELPKNSRLTKVEIDRIIVILVLTTFCVAFWSVFEQAGSSLNTFAKNLTNRRVPAVIAQLAPGAFLVNEDKNADTLATEGNESGEAAAEMASESAVSETKPQTTETAENMAAGVETSETTQSDQPPIYTFPATWYQSVNPLGIVTLAPLFALLWGFLARRKREPSTPLKFGIGLTLLATAYMFMVTAAMQAEKTNGNAAAHWLFTTYVFCTLGELCLSPVGLSMVTRLAPKKYASLLMGVWFLSSAVAGYLSGHLAAVLGSSDGTGGQINFFFGKSHGLADYFLLMTLAPLVAGAIVFVLVPKLKKMMHEEAQ